MNRFMKWPEHKDIEHKRRLQDYGLINWIRGNKAKSVCVVSTVYILWISGAFV